MPYTKLLKVIDWQKILCASRCIILPIFQAGNQKELSFSAGQCLFLAPKNQQPNVRGWLLASNKKSCGLVPANYIKILGLRQGSPEASNNVSKQGKVTLTVCQFSHLVYSWVEKKNVYKYIWFSDLVKKRCYVEAGSAVYTCPVHCGLFYTYIFFFSYKWLHKCLVTRSQIVGLPDLTFLNPIL